MKPVTLNLLVQFSQRKATSDDSKAGIECLFATCDELFEGGKKYYKVHYVAEVVEDIWYEVIIAGKFIGAICESCFKSLEKRAP